jgi:hypothetical protein
MSHNRIVRNEVDRVSCLLIAVDTIPQRIYHRIVVTGIFASEIYINIRAGV